MPTYGPWTSDPAIYRANNVGPSAWGFTEVDSTNDGGVGALAGSATAALDDSSTSFGVSVISPDIDFIFEAFEGFIVLDLESLLVPLDPSVAYPPQIPWDDPGTLRPDWLGNLPPFDPYLGVQFASTAGTQAIDQPLGVTLGGGAVAGGTGTPPDAAVWAVDASVLSLSGGVWTATSVPLNSVDAAIAAAAWQYTGIAPVLVLGYEYGAVTTTVPRSILRSGRYLTFAVSTESPAFDPGPAGWGAGFFNPPLGPASGNVPFRNPNYRLIFAGDTYQRSYPRDDDLGAGDARSWPPPTSSQRGVRSLPNAVF